VADAYERAALCRAVLELHAHFFHYELVKRAITMSLEKSDRERELVSRLISTLYVCVACPSTSGDH